MDDQPRYRQLEQLPEFTAQIDAIIERYSEQVIGPVIDGLMWGIASNPQEYDRTTWNMRIAKSPSFGLTIPRLRIFFQILGEGKEDERVLLCWIEETDAMDDIAHLM
jgi:hypothetical protein